MKSDPGTNAFTSRKDGNGPLGIPLGRVHEAQRPKRKKRTKYITLKQAMNLIEALHFAEHIGLPLNLSVDINWDMFSGTVDDQMRFSKLQERISKWFQRRGFCLTLIWVREIGEYGTPNTHLLVHSPDEFIENGQFRAALERTLEPEGGPIDEKAIKIGDAYYPLGKLIYMLKGVDPCEAGTLVALLGVEFDMHQQGEIEGKRVGCSENIGQRARRRALFRAAQLSQRSITRKERTSRSVK